MGRRRRGGLTNSLAGTPPQHFRKQHGMVPHRHRWVLQRRGDDAAHHHGSLYRWERRSRRHILMVNKIVIALRTGDALLYSI
jgi:hypothetical protein